MRFYDLCGIMPGRPAKLIVNLCEQPGCSLPSPLHLTHCLAEEEQASRGIERVQRLRFCSQQLSLSSLNFNGKAKFFQLSFHTLPLSLSLALCLSVSLCLWSRRPHVLATIFLAVGNCCCGPSSCCCYCCSG